MHLVAEPGQHPANLPILALVEHHLQHGAQLVLGADRHPLGMHLAFREPHAAAQRLEQLFRGHARHLDEVFLLDAVSRVGEQVGEPAIVGDEDQPLAHPVEPADGEEPLVSRHEIDDPGPAGGVEVRGHDADRLVEQKHDPLRVREPLPVHADLLGVRIDPRAEFRDDLPIHLDAAGRDQLLAGATAAEAGPCQHLLQPLAAVVVGVRPRPTRGRGVGVRLGRGMRPSRGDPHRPPRRRRRPFGGPPAVVAAFAIAGVAAGLGPIHGLPAFGGCRAAVPCDGPVRGTKIIHAADRT